MIKAALHIGAKGKPVFPCKPDKAPYYEKTVLEHGCLDATTDPRKITAWWTRWPEANTGIPTGKASGIFVVDLDTYMPGAMTLAEFEEKYGPIPDTATVRTGSGGVQLLFAYPNGEEIRNSTGMLGPHVDTRGEGGYILAPPSVTTGRYEWINKAPPAPIPPRLLEALREKPRNPCRSGRSWSVPSRTNTPEDEGPILEGTRNNTLTAIGGRRRAEGCEYEEILTALEFVNRRRCEPELPEAEVEQIARSVARYAKGTTTAVTPQTRTAINRYQQEVLHGRAYTRIGDLSIHDVIIAIILKARRFGWLDEDGNVIVSISYRELALMAATRLETAYKAVARAKREGLLASANAGRRRGQAGAFKLLIPRRAYPEHSDHARETGKNTNDGESVPPLRAPLLRHHAAGYWRLGKGAAAVVHYLEGVSGGSATLREIADALGMRRWRDLYRTGPNPRGRVWRLVEGGVATITGDRVALVEGYLEVIDERREEGGEFAARREQIRRFNQDRERYHGEPVKSDRAPSEREMGEYQATRPPLAGDAIRAHVAIMNPNSNPGRVYATSYGTDLATMAGAVAAHFGESRGDPRAWKRWLDPVAQALAAMDGEARDAVSA